MPCSECWTPTNERSPPAAAATQAKNDHVIGGDGRKIFSRRKKQGPHHQRQNCIFPPASLHISYANNLVMMLNVSFSEQSTSAPLPKQPAAMDDVHLAGIKGCQIDQDIQSQDV
jgi:hypothetical protein